MQQDLVANKSPAYQHHLADPWHLPDDLDLDADIILRPGKDQTSR